MRIRPTKRLIPMFAMAGVLLNFDAAFACSTKKMAYRVAMRSDLRNLVSAEAEFLREKGRYSARIDSLSFRASTGVTSVIRAESAGWTATATHTVSTEVCHIFVGARPAGTPAEVGAEEPWCEDPTATFLENERLGSLLALPAVFVLGALALSAAVFLSRKPKPNWGLWGLTALFLFYVFARGMNCSPPTVGFVAFYLAIGATMFLATLRRRMLPP